MKAKGDCWRWKAASRIECPAPTINLALGVIPSGTRRFEAFDKTIAWCWQQGTMLQWLPGSANSVIYNQRAGNRFVSVIRDLNSGEVRSLPMPIYAVSPNGDYALSLNFARLNHQRPGYGYEGVPDHTKNDLCPSKDGVYSLDLRSGAWKLIFSLAQAADLNRVESMDGAMQKFNHIQIAPDGSRFAVIHRWRPPTEGREIRCDRLITAIIRTAAKPIFCPIMECFRITTGLIRARLSRGPKRLKSGAVIFYSMTKLRANR